ncbi:hypothetical protein OROGR_017213 [Orobanche gracilis]
MAEPKSDSSLSVMVKIPWTVSGKDAKAPNVFERVKEKFDAVLLHNNKKQGHHRHKETHGLRDDMDVNKSMSDVKAPNLFERANEEIEAIVGAIHCRKGSKDSDMPIYGGTRKPDTKDPLDTDKSDLHSGLGDVIVWIMHTV